MIGISLRRIADNEALVSDCLDVQDDIEPHCLHISEYSFSSAPHICDRPGLICQFLTTKNAQSYEFMYHQSNSTLFSIPVKYQTCLHVARCSLNSSSVPDISTWSCMFTYTYFQYGTRHVCMQLHVHLTPVQYQTCLHGATCSLNSSTVPDMSVCSYMFT